jgi:hypothetical protein
MGVLEGVMRETLLVLLLHADERNCLITVSFAN